MTKNGTMANSNQAMNRLESQSQTDTEEKTAAGEPEAEDTAGQTDIFRYALTICLLALLFFVAVRFFTHRSATQLAFYEAITAQTTEQPVQTASDVQTRGKHERKININTATAEELTQLPGIGEARAQAILAYRRNYGRITDVEQLLEIDGIGQKLIEEIAPNIVF